MLILWILSTLSLSVFYKHNETKSASHSSHIFTVYLRPNKLDIVIMPFFVCEMTISTETDAHNHRIRANGNFEVRLVPANYIIALLITGMAVKLSPRVRPWKKRPQWIFKKKEGSVLSTRGKFNQTMGHRRSRENQLFAIPTSREYTLYHFDAPK